MCELWIQRSDCIYLLDLTWFMCVTYIVVECTKLANLNMLSVSPRAESRRSYDMHKSR